MRVGFVGLGSQGGPMARRIIEAGFPTTLWARRAESLEPFTDTPASMAGSPAELGSASDVLACASSTMPGSTRSSAAPTVRWRRWPMGLS